MRRPLTLAAVCALILVGCGSSSSTHSAAAGSGALASELSYFDPGSPLVVSLGTDPTAASVSSGSALLHRFPLAAFGESYALGKLSALGIDYQTDVKPLLGNPLSLAADTSTSIGTAAKGFLVAWRTSSAAKLDALIKKIPGLRSQGSFDGARVYGLGGLAAAVDGATIVLGGSAATVRAGLDRHAHGTGFDAAEYSRLTAGLPREALLQVFGDLRGVLSSAKAAQARSIPWIGAVRGYAVALSAGASAVSLHFRVDTSGAALTSAQLPIAPGSASASFAGSLPISVGITNPAQALGFLLNTAEQLKASGYKRFQRAEARLRARHGFDLTSFIAQLTGSATLNSDGHTTMFRATLSDPAKAQREFTALIEQPGLLFSSPADRVRSLGGGFLLESHGTSRTTFGISSGQLLVGAASVARLKEFATAPGTAATGAQGSIAFRVALGSLLQLALLHAPSGLAGAVLARLGDITGWAQASPTALTGTASLAIR